MPVINDAVRDLANTIRSRHTPPEFLAGCEVKAITDINEYAANNGWIEAVCHEHNQQRVRYKGFPSNVSVSDLVDVMHFPDRKAFEIWGSGGTVATVATASGITALNTAGATAAAGDVGYLDDSSEYKTTTTAEDERARPVAVVGGGANNADILVTDGPGRMTLNYTGTAPADGDFLTFSATAGKVQARATMHPGVVGRASAAGSGGTVQAELLLQTKPLTISSANDVYATPSASRVSDSDFQALIDSLPGGAAVRYDTPTAGTEDNLKPESTSQLGKMVLHNTTRSNSALISDNDPTGGAGYDGEITLTATVPGDWVATDAIEIRSQTNTSTQGSGRYMDFDLSGATEIPELTRWIECEMTVHDTGGVGLQYRVHPFEANANSKRKGCNVIVSGASNANAITVKIPLISRTFCAAWNASGASTARFVLKLNKIHVAG